MSSMFLATIKTFKFTFTCAFPGNICLVLHNNEKTKNLVALNIICLIHLLIYRESLCFLEILLLTVLM